MKLRERSTRESGGDDDAAVPIVQAAGGGGGAGAATSAMLGVADDAIDRALSQDSTRFLSQNRQHGGQ